MKKTILLHKDVYMPKWMQSKVRKVLNKYKRFVLSKHVKEHAALDNDRSHRYVLSKLNESIEYLLEHVSSCDDAFEVEMTQFDYPYPHWLITKVCIRTRYDDDQDVCLSIRTAKDMNTNVYLPDVALIVTAWLNHKNDSHRTLESSKYLDEKEFKITFYNQNTAY